MPEPKAIPTLQYKDFSLTVHNKAMETNRVVKAQMELTYRCNLHCIHCYTDPYNKQEFFSRELTFNEITRILDEMADLGILWLNFTGGEIFSRPGFFDIYDYAARKGFLLQLYTNGTIFTEAIVQRLKESPPFSIDVSCHSVTEEAFDRFTQVPGSFRKFTRGMDLLRDSGLPFCFKTKAMSWNKDEIPQIKDFVESFGQSFGFTTSLAPRLNGDLSSLAYRLAPEEIRTLEESHYNGTHEDESCEEMSWDTPEAPRGLYRCGCGTNTIHISAWGELGTCTMQYERRASLREYALKDAIAKVFQDVRAMSYTTESPCSACAVYAFCEKKPTEARWECGDAEAPIPYHCEVALTRAQRVSPHPLIHPLRTHSQWKGATDE